MRYLSTTSVHCAQILFFPGTSSSYLAVTQHSATRRRIAHCHFTVYLTVRSQLMTEPWHRISTQHKFYTFNSTKIIQQHLSALPISSHPFSKKKRCPSAAFSSPRHGCSRASVESVPSPIRVLTWYVRNARLIAAAPFEPH